MSKPYKYVLDLADVLDFPGHPGCDSNLSSPTGAILVQIEFHDSRCLRIQPCASPEALEYDIGYLCVCMCVCVCVCVVYTHICLYIHTYIHILSHT